MPVNTIHRASVASEPDISLRDLIAPLRRFRKTLILSFFAILFASWLVTAFLFRARYESRMQILIRRDRPDPVVTAQAVGPSIPFGSTVPEEEINSEAELIRSRDVLERVVAANGLDKSQAVNHLWSGWLHRDAGEPQRRERAIQELGSVLTVRPVLKSDILDVSYTSSTPGTAYSVLRSLQSAYLDEHARVHEHNRVSQLFSDQTRHFADALAQDEKKLRDLSKHSAAPELTRQGVATELTDALGHLHAAERAISADEARGNNDRARLKQTPERAVSTRSSSISSQLIQEAGGQLLKAQTRRAELIMKYDPSYPLVQEADKEVQLAEQAFRDAQSKQYIAESTERDPEHDILREDLAKAQIDLAAQQATRQAAMQEIGTMKDRLAALDDDLLTLRGLERDAKAQEESYLLYRSKSEQERVSSALNAEVQNVSVATPPSMPVLPLPRLLSPPLLSLLIALVGSLIVTYIAAYLDPSFRTRAEVMEALDVPVVFEISKYHAA